MRDQNKTFTKLATAFDERLQEYRDAEQNVTDARSFLNQQEAARDNAAEAMRKARDELLEAYPELAPQGQTPSPAGEWQPPGPGAFTPIEVDDPDDVPDFRERT